MFWARHELCTMCQAAECMILLLLLHDKYKYCTGRLVYNWLLSWGGRHCLINSAMSAISLGSDAWPRSGYDLNVALYPTLFRNLAGSLSVRMFYHGILLTVAQQERRWFICIRNDLQVINQSICTLSIATKSLPWKVACQEQAIRCIQWHQRAWSLKTIL